MIVKTLPVVRLLLLLTRSPSEYTRGTPRPHSIEHDSAATPPAQCVPSPALPSTASEKDYSLEKIHYNNNDAMAVMLVMYRSINYRL